MRILELSLQAVFSLSSCFFVSSYRFFFKASSTVVYWFDGCFTPIFPQPYIIASVYAVSEQCFENLKSRLSSCVTSLLDWKTHVSPALALILGWLYINSPLIEADKRLRHQLHSAFLRKCLYMSFHLSFQDPFSGDKSGRSIANPL